MAIPSQQIGWSQRAKLLWQISKQLENLIKVAGNVQVAPATATYYNVAGCERMEYHVIKYTGTGTLAEGTIVNNATPECWFIVDQATGPEDVGTIAYVWDTPNDCQPCINSHTTTTTTTIVPTTTTTTTSEPVTVTAGISSIQYIACGGGGMSITVGLSGTTICDSNTVYNTSGDFVGFTDIWLAVNGVSRLYTNVDDVSAVSSIPCVSCPGLTAAISSIDACTGAVGSVLLVPTYAGPPLLCDCTSFTASDAIILSAGTYFVSNGNFARPFSYPGSGTTLTAVGTCSPC